MRSFSPLPPAPTNAPPPPLPGLPTAQASFLAQPVPYNPQHAHAHSAFASATRHTPAYGYSHSALDSMTSSSSHAQHQHQHQQPDASPNAYPRPNDSRSTSISGTLSSPSSSHSQHSFAQQPYLQSAAARNPALAFTPSPLYAQHQQQQHQQQHSTNSSVKSIHSPNSKPSTPIPANVPFTQQQPQQQQQQQQPVLTPIQQLTSSSSAYIQAQAQAQGQGSAGNRGIGASPNAPPPLPEPMSTPAPQAQNLSFGPTPLPDRPTNESNGAPAQVQHTNIVHYQNRRIKCAINPALPVAEVVRFLCLSTLRIADPPALFALRVVGTDELVHDSNLGSLIKAKATLKLVSSPVIEAAEMYDKLRACVLNLSSSPHSSAQANPMNAQALKACLFQLSRYVKERTFLRAFIDRRGHIVVWQLAESESGNTRAYALQATLNIHRTARALIKEDSFSSPVDAAQTIPEISLPGTAPELLVSALRTEPNSNLRRAVLSLLNYLYPSPQHHAAIYKNLIQPLTIAVLRECLGAADVDLAAITLQTITFLLSTFDGIDPEPAADAQTQAEISLHEILPILYDGFSRASVLPFSKMWSMYLLKRPNVSLRVARFGAAGTFDTYAEIFSHSLVCVSQCLRAGIGIYFSMDITRFLIAVVAFWLRMSKDLPNDIDRLQDLVLFYIRTVLDEHKTWESLERDLTTTSFAEARKRQLSQIRVLADGAWAVSGLEQRMREQTSQYVYNQQIDMMVEGAWFAIPSSMINTPNMSPGLDVSRPVFRHLRLAPAKGSLHYFDASSKCPVPALSECAGRIAVKDVHTVKQSAGSITLFTEMGDKLLELLDTDGTNLRQWVIALNTLSTSKSSGDDENHSIVQTLAALQTQIRLLDITARNLQLPSDQPALPTRLPAGAFVYAMA